MYQSQNVTKCSNKSTNPHNTNNAPATHMLYIPWHWPDLTGDTIEHYILPGLQALSSDAQEVIPEKQQVVDLMFREVAAKIQLWVASLNYTLSY